MEERWTGIPGFSKYLISNYGEVCKTNPYQEMSITKTNHGHAKVSLVSDSGSRHTRSISLLVAQAFVEAPNPMCDHVILLDGDLNNLRADNMAWRPNWFAWRYTQQLKAYLPQHYYNLKVRNINTGIIYSDIANAGVVEGLLFDDIWRSTFSGSSVYPNRHKFEIVQ